MKHGVRRAIPGLSTSATLLLGAMILLVASQRSDSQPADAASEGAALDHQLSEAYLRQDWAALEKMVAPDYAGLALDEQWDFAALKREFPKIHALEYKVERQQVKRLSPDLMLVSDVFTMRETYDGQDISGHYWSSDVWVRRKGKWLLLVEQEVPLK
jgi:hypothetical protein